MTNAYMLFYERCTPSSPGERSPSSDSPEAAVSSLAPSQPSADSLISSSAPSSPLSPTSPQRTESGQMAESLVRRASAAHSNASSTLSERESATHGRWNGKYAAGAANSTLRIDTKPPSSAHSSPLHTPSSSGSSTRSSMSASRPPRSLQLWLGSIPSLPAPSSLPGWLVRSIWQDNVDFLRDKQLFDFSCQSFLFHVCSRMAAATQQQRQQRMADSTQQAQIATFYVFKVRTALEHCATQPEACDKLATHTQPYTALVRLCVRVRTLSCRCCVGRLRMAPFTSGWSFCAR